MNQKIDWSRLEIQSLQQSFEARFLLKRNEIEQSARIELQTLQAMYGKKLLGLQPNSLVTSDSYMSSFEDKNLRP